MPRILFLAAFVAALLFPPLAAAQQRPPEDVKALRKIMADLANAKAAISAAESDIAAAEAKLLEFATSPPVVVDPPSTEPDPPIIVDPPPPTNLAAGPDFSQAPFVSLMPAWPTYRFPTLADCEWTIQGGVATSMRGLPAITAATIGEFAGDLCGDAMRASIAAGHAEPITFGVYDDAGHADVGGYYWHTSPRSICVSNGAGGWRPLRVEFLGLTDSAEVSLNWCGTTGGQEWGRSEYVAAFNIGLRGAPSSFGINANKPHGVAILDGCWFLNPKGWASTQRYNAAITVAHGHTLVIRRTKWRGKLPTDPGALYQQHNFYLKNTGPGGYFITENQWQGSNGTCMQIRPGTDEPMPVPPAGPVVVAYNFSNGYGFEWGTGSGSEHGGAGISYWSGPNQQAFFYRNRILDARYGCFLVSQQAPVPAESWIPQHLWGTQRDFVGTDGYPIGAVYVADNEFTNPRASRQAVSISGCSSAHIWSTNKLGGQWHLNSQWAAERGFLDLQIGSIKLYGGAMQGENYLTFDGVQTRPMTTAEVNALRVASPTPL